MSETHTKNWFLIILLLLHPKEYLDIVYKNLYFMLLFYAYNTWDFQKTNKFHLGI